MFFFFNDTSPTETYTLSLHDALPISPSPVRTTFTFSLASRDTKNRATLDGHTRSEEHTSELQSHSDLVCRLLLEKKNATRSARARGSWSRRPWPTTSTRSASFRATSS